MKKIKIIKKINACDKINSVVIQMRSLGQFSHVQKAQGTKKYQKGQKAQKRNQAKTQNANNGIKIKNLLKIHLSGKKSLICLFGNKSLYNKNVGLTKPIKVLYEQKLVY